VTDDELTPDSPSPDSPDSPDSPSEGAETSASADATRSTEDSGDAAQEDRRVASDESEAPPSEPAPAPVEAQTEPAPVEAAAEPEPDAAPAPEPAAAPAPEPEADAESDAVLLAEDAAPVPDAAAVPDAAPVADGPEILAEAEVGSEPEIVVEGEPVGEAEAEDDIEEAVDETPRVRPEIPGADLIPDIVPEGDEFLDAEARAAAEADAEAQAAQAARDREEEASRPIADAAIDLAAGARYTSTGKRKTAVARVILKPGSGSYAINGKPLDDYFPRETLRRVIRQPLETVGYESRMDVVARMHGGGVSAQAEALRHGISKALIVADPNLRGELKRRGFLTRDPRVKERKKAGLKKARKRPQFSKR
jgi:small subunit ribosomal protein S9